MANIGIIGSEGRMGKAIAEAIQISHADAHTVAGAVDRDGDVEALAAAADVLIDFSSPPRWRPASMPPLPRASPS